MHIGLNAHLLSSRAGYRKAGIHSYIEGLLNHLAAAAPAGWQFTAMTGRAFAGKFPEVATCRSRIDTESPLRRIVWEQLIQPAAMRRFDLVHALAFIAPVIATRPYVVTVYDLSFIHYPERLPASRRLYLQTLTGPTCHRARRVIAISESTAHDLTDTLGIPPDKIDLAPPGYDPTVFHPLDPAVVAEFRRRHHLPDAYWLFIGTLEPRKNLVTLLEAYARLTPSERLPLILGGGKGWDYEPIFTAVERLRLTDWVRFPGFIPDSDLPFWYNGAQVFVYPSVFEGFGLPVLEAMACGTPVIGADVSSVPEVMGEAGRRVPPHDVDAWAYALRMAHDEHWRAAARARGLIEARRYTWENTAQAVIRSYQLAAER
ncbi:MAG: glycosyltransferase family 4 protein [Anaerolinea sp.]|nr:glycosyltransferase family 4 protein [Anaerolinea sp.]